MPGVRGRDSALVRVEPELSLAKQLEKRRGHLVIEPSTVRVVFENDDPESDHVVALFECRTCGVVLDWIPSARMWFCPECGYELTPVEAEIVLLRANRLLMDRMTDSGKKRGGWWVSVRLFLVRLLLGI